MLVQRQQREGERFDPLPLRVGAALMLMLAYGASVGGLLTPGNDSAGYEAVSGRLDEGVVAVLLALVVSETTSNTASASVVSRSSSRSRWLPVSTR